MRRRAVVFGAALAITAFTVPISHVVGQSRRDLSRQALVEDPTAPKSARFRFDVTVVEFSDYNCPYCRRLEPALAALMASDLRVRIVYRDWPILGPSSRQAARLAIASQWQGRHAAFHAALMTSSGRLDDAAIKSAAARAKVDWPRLRRDLKVRGAEIDALLARTDAFARAVGLSGTPALIVGRQLVPGSVDLATLRTLVAGARSEKLGA